ncbi:hypothetical protein MLD38_007123 [Melastoma candidum]|uniref:Uncharacterized protein n=1 Tax=Melastoma candidum TaxID=119954 RepID=A0ACB9RTV2_9MYRT|nr:hypothetical protein MLD38_007123 [Melastoma candidum]
MANRGHSSNLLLLATNLVLSLSSLVLLGGSITLEDNFHDIQVSSLFPATSCTSSLLHPNTNTNTEVDVERSSLKVLPRHGPCSPLASPKVKPPTPDQILNRDELRVNSIVARISGQKPGPSTLEDSKADLPAKPGSTVGTGNYVVTVGLGTPKKDLTLIFDTGSDLTWTQCQPCARYCYKQQDPTFDPSLSTSYTNISCSSAACSQLVSATGSTPGCSVSTCVYGIQYGDSSYSVGFFGSEKLSLTTTDSFNNFLFGCGQNNRGLFGGAAGLLGLGRDKLSIVEQTASKYGKYFSYCLPPSDSSTGHLTFGKGSSSVAQFTPLKTISQGASFYGISILGISVGGKKLPIPVSVFSNAEGIIDSGTVITRLPPTAYNALRSEFQQLMTKYPKAPALSILDTCYDFTKYPTVTIPKVGFWLGGGAYLDLDSSGILYAASMSQVCLAFAGNSDDNEVLIFGNVQQKKYEVVYDLVGGRLGFQANGCA